MTDDQTPKLDPLDIEEIVRSAVSHEYGDNANEIWRMYYLERRKVKFLVALLILVGVADLTSIFINLGQ